MPPNHAPPIFGGSAFDHRTSVNSRYLEAGRLLNLLVTHVRTKPYGQVSTGEQIHDGFQFCISVILDHDKLLLGVTNNIR